MVTLYWNPLAINMFIQSMMALMIAIFLLFSISRLKERRQTALLAITFSATACATLAQFGSYALHPNYTNYALPWVSVFGAIAMGFFVRFAFEFNRPFRESARLSLAINVIYGAIILLEIYVALGRLSYLAKGAVEYRDAWLDIPSPFGFLLGHIFLVERLNAAIAKQRQSSRRNSALSTLHAMLTPWSRLPPEPAAIRAFLYAASLPFFHAIVLIVRSYSLLEWEVVEPFLSALMLATLCVFSLAYLNHVPEQSSFQIKLVGGTVVVLLAILSGLSWLIGPVYLESYQSPHRLKDQSTVRFEPLPGGSYRASHSVFHFDEDIGRVIDDPIPAQPLPFLFPFYGNRYDSFFVREDGIIGFDHRPWWRDITHQFGPQPAIYALSAELQRDQNDKFRTSGLYLNAKSDLVVLTWNALVSSFSPTEKYTFQARLYPTGVIELSYKNMPDALREDMFRSHSAPMMMGIVPSFENREVAKVRFASGLPVTGLPQQGMMEHYREDFIVYLDKIYQPIAWYIFWMTLVILLIFPRFFQVNLNQPLKGMIAGVKGVLEGNLTSKIKVFHRDEIGYLATAFNKMARSQHELITSLEDQVQARSAEAAALAAENARLEERNHLARELHDSVSQTLFSANLIAGSLSQRQDDPEKLKENVETIERLNQHALREMRQLLVELRPDHLMQNKFGELLARLLERFEGVNNIEVTLCIENDTTLPKPVQLAFYRAAQECLNNAAKHANATQIQITFDGIEDQAFLSVQDNGSGFEHSDKSWQSFGLSMMAERLEELSATLEVASTLGQGTKITAIWYEND